MKTWSERIQIVLKETANHPFSQYIVTREGAMLMSKHFGKPVQGMTVALKPTASQSLAGIPATIIEVWPRFRSGDYLVTLQYASPVKHKKMLIRHIDAFMSELDVIEDAALHQQEAIRQWLATRLLAA